MFVKNSFKNLADFSDTWTAMTDDILFLYSQSSLHHLPMSQVSYGVIGKLFLFKIGPEIKKKPDPGHYLWLAHS